MNKWLHRLQAIEVVKHTTIRVVTRTYARKETLIVLSGSVATIQPVAHL